MPYAGLETTSKQLSCKAPAQPEPEVCLQDQAHTVLDILCACHNTLDALTNRGLPGKDDGKPEPGLASVLPYIANLAHSLAVRLESLQRTIGQL